MKMVLIISLLVMSSVTIPADDKPVPAKPRFDINEMMEVKKVGDRVRISFRNSERNLTPSTFLSFMTQASSKILAYSDKEYAVRVVTAGRAARVLRDSDLHEFNEGLLLKHHCPLWNMGYWGSKHKNMFLDVNPFGTDSDPSEFYLIIAKKDIIYFLDKELKLASDSIQARTYED